MSNYPMNSRSQFPSSSYVVSDDGGGSSSSDEEYSSKKMAPSFVPVIHKTTDPSNIAHSLPNGFTVHMPCHIHDLNCVRCVPVEQAVLAVCTKCITAQPTIDSEDTMYS
jgi:hypothetical protein